MKTLQKHKIFDNLLNQNFKVNCKNKVWCTDFTYMRRPNGKFRYNCSITDLYDRVAIASVNGDYINTQLAIDTLTQALEKEKYPSVILHSDQGVTKKLDRYKKSFPKSMKNSLPKRKISTSTTARRKKKCRKF